jgi:hypothetical protein
MWAYAEWRPSWESMGLHPINSTWPPLYRLNIDRVGDIELRPHWKNHYQQQVTRIDVVVRAKF